MTDATDRTATAPPQRGFFGVPTLIARLIVGGVLVKYGVSKIQDPVQFLKAVKSYDILPLQPPEILNLTAVVLPWLEVIIGVLLILGLARRGGATISFLMLTVFTLAIAKLGYDYQQLHPEMAFTAIELDCGCGGGPVNVARKLAMNSGLIGLSGWLMVSNSHRFLLKPGG